MDGRPNRGKLKLCFHISPILCGGDLTEQNNDSALEF